MKKHFRYSNTAVAVMLAISSAFANEAPTQLEEITVVGSVAKAGKVDYMTPRSVAILNTEKLQDWQQNQLDSVLRYEAGATAQTYGADLDTNDWLKMRGLDTRLTLDGTAVYNTGYSHWTPNMYGVETVEVIKGSDSLTYGAAQSGGLINLVTKRPTLEPKGEVKFKGGNRHERGLSADVSNKLSENVRYRLVADYNKKQGELRGSWLENYYFAPSLTWDISERNTLTLLANVQKDVGVPTTGFFPMQGTLNTQNGEIDRRTNLGDPTSDFLDRKQYSLGYEFVHKFDDGLTFSQNYKFNMQETVQQSAFFNSVIEFPTVNQGAIFNDVITRSHSIDNRVSKHWQTERTENTLTVGMDYQHLQANGVYNSYYLNNPADLLNGFAPRYHGINVPTTARPLYDVTQRQLGTYVQNHFRLNNWHVNAGIRHDRAKGEEISGGNAQAAYRLHNTAYSAGTMYIAESGFVPYFNYAESFTPETAQYKPTKGRQYEAGVKYLPNFVDGTFSVAYFNIKQDNAFTPNPTGLAFQTEAMRSNGVEVTANFNVAEKTGVTLAYSYNRVKDQRADGTVIRPALVARHSASAQISQQFTDNLSLGAALRYIGTSANGTADTVKVPARTLADLMLKYKLNANWILQGNISNLTDKKYVTSCFWSTCYYGEGRKINASLTYQF